MALIVGSIIGVGIFNLPTSLAVLRPDHAWSRWALTTVGALALALLFAALSRRLPADGGPYAYARVAFGNPLGLRERLVVLDHGLGRQRRDRGRLGALRRGVRQQGPQPAGAPCCWCWSGCGSPPSINLSGVKNMGSVQVITTVLKFVALAFMSTVGLFFIEQRQLHAVERQRREHDRRDRRRHGDRPVQLPGRRDAPRWPPAKVRDPDRNIPRATILGTLATAVVYMLSLTAVFGILPSSQLAESTAPFSDAVNAMFGGTWAGNVMAVAVIISGFGALNGWTMICAEMPLAAAKDGLFPEPFKRISQHGRAGVRHRRLDRRSPRSPWSSTTSAPAAPRCSRRWC